MKVSGKEATMPNLEDLFSGSPLYVRYRIRPDRPRGSFPSRVHRGVGLLLYHLRVMEDHLFPFVTRTVCLRVRTGLNAKAPLGRRPDPGIAAYQGRWGRTALRSAAHRQNVVRH